MYILQANMSVFMNEVIKLCKEEEAKLTERIRHCKDILHSMKILVNDSNETHESPSVNVKEDISLKEQQEIDLLEQVLKKALKVRSSSAVPAHLGVDLQDKKPLKTSHTSETKKPVKNTVKDADKTKVQKVSPLTEVQKRRHQGGGMVKGPAVHGHIHTQPVLVKRRSPTQPTRGGKLLAAKSAPGQVFRVDDQKKSCEPGTHSKHSYREKMIVGPLSEEKELKTSPFPPVKELWVPSPLLPVWRAQRIKKNSLWNKVLAQHSKPVLERTHFKERLISTFPMERSSGQAAAGGVELNALTQLGLDLTHCYHAELQGQQLLSACVPGNDPETLMEKEYESLLMLEGLEIMMAKVIKDASLLKKEWERKVVGPMYPLQKRGEWGNPRQTCLPPMLFYSTKAELEELETLRLKVDLLQLEVRLHQAMSDTLTHHMTPHHSTSGRPNATVLRGLYSLLGEGGTQFPALVLDSEPNQT